MGIIIFVEFFLIVFCYCLTHKKSLPLLDESSLCCLKSWWKVAALAACLLLQENTTAESNFGEKGFIWLIVSVGYSSSWWVRYGSRGMRLADRISPPHRKQRERTGSWARM